jgi:hypothetical protein
MLSAVALWQAVGHGRAQAQGVAPAQPTRVVSPAAPSPAVPSGAQTPGPRPAEAPRVQRAPVVAPGALVARRVLLARGVENREPIGVSASFRRDGAPVYAFLEVQNLGAPTTVTVRFARVDDPTRTVGNVVLSVPTSARWRTWSFTRLARTPGAWAAVVEGADGQPLGRAEFTVR